MPICHAALRYNHKIIDTNIFNYIEYYITRSDFMLINLSIQILSRASLEGRIATKGPAGKLDLL